ncbi:hypothetical protein D3C81_1961650 [compost metagenome]
MRPLLVSITSRFSGATVRHALSTMAEAAGVGAASCAQAEPARIRTDAAAAKPVETRILVPFQGR